MTRILFIISFLSICFNSSVHATNSPWLSEETCRENLAGGEDYLAENYKNGGTQFFTDPQKRSHLVQQLEFFNDTFETDLRVYCGRFFLNYDTNWNWDTSLYSMLSPALRSAYNNYTLQFGGDRTGVNAIQAFYPAYQQYIDRPGANMLVVYLQCHYYVNSDTNNVVAVMNVIGLISRGITGDNVLRVEYLKSGAVTNSIRAIEDSQDKINAYVDEIVDEFSAPVVILNAHCPECPLHPTVGTDYWDDAGRLWRWMEGADHNLKWMDLSYEFPEEGQGYDLSWKPTYPDAVQLYHQKLFADKISLLRNDPLQHSLGGVTPELEKHIWRATQFAAVNNLKELHIHGHIAIWENFIPVWGNVKSAYYSFQVANGDLVYQVNGGVSIAMAAIDIILCEGFINHGFQGALRSPLTFVENGFQFFNTLGSRIIIYGQQSVVKLNLILALRRAPQMSLDFFTNRALPRAMEIFDQNTAKYIKYNPDNGKALVAQFSEKLDGTCELAFEREVTIPNTAGTNEQAIAENVITAIDNIEDGIFNSFKNETGIQATKAADPNLSNTVRSWQGSGNYPGIDDWYVIEIPAGTKVYGGLPGPSPFFSVEKTLVDANSNKSMYWQSLQVRPDPVFGLRPKVGEYVTTVPTKVAVSRTLANPQYGNGGAWQFYIEDFANKVSLSREITLSP